FRHRVANLNKEIREIAFVPVRKKRRSLDGGTAFRSCQCDVVTSGATHVECRLPTKRLIRGEHTIPNSLFYGLLCRYGNGNEHAKYNKTVATWGSDNPPPSGRRGREARDEGVPRGSQPPPPPLRGALSQRERAFAITECRGLGFHKEGIALFARISH